VPKEQPRIGSQPTRHFTKQYTVLGPNSSLLNIGLKNDFSEETQPVFQEIPLSEGKRQATQ